MFEQLRRDLSDAQNRTGGMHVGLPKVTVDCSHLQHLLDLYDRQKDVLDSTRVELARAKAALICAWVALPLAPDGKAPVEWAAEHYKREIAHDEP